MTPNQDLQVLIVEDDAELRAALLDTLELAGLDCHAVAGGRAALDVLETRRAELVVSDVCMDGMDGLTLLNALKAAHPELPVLLMTAYGTVQQAVDAMRAGAADYLIKPFEAEVLVGKASTYVGTGARVDAELIAVDEASLEMVSLARRVAASEVTVMLSGESGTGKEVFARYIHRHSRRANAPFVALNCAAIPDNMLEAILFGYEKGAFTGAYKACPGKFEQAQGGTVLLDEVTEMDLGLQAKLLRVLQEREVERLGARDTIALDVRVFATTNRDINAAVAAGDFREDSFYRLNVFPVRLPPLRERPDDIVPLATHLLQVAAIAAGQAAPPISASCEARLRAHPWPGNVRELDNVMQRALVLSYGPTIEPESLHFETAATPARLPAMKSVAADMNAEHSLDDGLKASEHRLIIEALAAGSGSRKAAAEKLGISARTLRYKLARMREAGMEIPAHAGQF